MNDTALKNFATWARTKLLMDVRTRAATYRIDADDAQANAIARVDGEVLSPQEQRQRADLLRMVRAEGFDALMERAAYTWFNRILAIRFMEVNDRLSSGVRLFSTGEGAFSRRTQAIEEALSLDIEGLDRQQVLDAIQASSDERLFRVLFLAQCAELSACMPAVFEPIGSAMELLLPDNLLATDGVIQHLVEDIPEQDWREGVEIVGWIYQYYNAERKDEFFSSKRKASASDLAPATQLFTPEWIVRYLAQNSLGRLWMLNHPDSKLAEQMKYYLSPEEGNCEDVRKVESPEEIAICDPACGSGHILVYAFDLLAAMYDETGYSRRDIPRLILEKNLMGFEIDPRAAQMASFALTMKACEVDTRFLRRAVAPRIVVLRRIELDEEDLARAPRVAAQKQLVDAMAHLDECGSLFAPSEDDMRAIEDDLTMLSGEDGDLFADVTLAKLKDMQQLCNELTRTFDTVIANPPYMGLKKLGSWYYEWLRKAYPDCYFDLYACFLQRSFHAAKGGYASLVTMFTWATDKSFLGFRKRVIRDTRIVSLLHMQPMVMPIAFDTSATVFFLDSNFDLVGSYAGISLSDCENGTLSTFPCSGRFHAVPMGSFNYFPESIFAYWASDSMVKAFRCGRQLGDLLMPRVGIQTGDTDRFLRLWWEVNEAIRFVPGCSKNKISDCPTRWRPYKNAGDYRKWYGHNETVVNWVNDGEEVIGLASFEHRKVMNLPSEYRFKPMVSWNDYGLGQAAFRYSPSGFLFDVIEPAFVDVQMTHREDLMYILALCNSATAGSFIDLLMPGRHKNVGKMAKLPLMIDATHEVEVLAERNVLLSRLDYDAFETSWDFERHPLL